jgi:hypothetical protein
MNTALEYSTRVVQEGGRRCKKSTLNDLVHLTPLRIPLMNPPLQLTEKKVLGHQVQLCFGIFFLFMNKLSAKEIELEKETLHFVESFI